VRPILAILLLAAACGTADSEIDPYPVSVDVSDGPLMIATSPGLDGSQIDAVIDTLSPITVLDPFVPGEPEAAPRRRQTDLVLYSGTGDTAIPRLSFAGVSTFELHPCTGVDGLCQLGVGDDTRPVRAILGADVLSRFAVRVDVPQSTIRLFPDIAGSNAARGRACEAVLDNPFAGGGTLVLGGSEVQFTGNRIAIGSCLHYDVDQPEQTDRGTDALFILSTGIAISVLSESSYDRYAAQVDDAAIAPALADLPETTLYMPSGGTLGRLGQISRLALVGEGSVERGPCQELYANHILATNQCEAAEDPVAPCPCANNQTFCSTAAAVEIERSFPVVVVDDLDPLLQALRDELRPNYPEVDGVLALSAVAPLSFDVDYPNGRLLVRCSSDAGCQARPAVRSRDRLPEIAACLPADPGTVN
jgi:hypothetical protein